MSFTNTQLRENVCMEGHKYMMIDKGHRKQETQRGGIVFLHRKSDNLKVWKLDNGDSSSSEDVLY